MERKPDWIERAWLRRHDSMPARLVWVVAIGLVLCALAAYIFWDAPRWIGAVGAAVATAILIAVSDARRRPRKSAERN